MLDILIEFLNILLQTVVSSYFTVTIFNLLSKNKIAKSRYTEIALLFFALNCFSVIIKNTFPYNLLTFIISISVYQKFVLKTKILNSIYFSFLFFFTMFFCEMLSTLIFIYVIGISAEALKQSIEYKFWIIACLSILMFIITLLVDIFINHKKELKNFFEELTVRQLINFIIIPLICIAPQTLILPLKRYDFPFSFLVVTYLQLIFFATYAFYSAKSYAEKERAKNDLIVSELHNKTMVSLVDGVKILKHDYNNIMQALNGYVLTKEYDKLQAHLNEVIKECNNINNLSAITPELFDEPAIYGIVGAKYFMAVDLDIVFDIDVTISSKTIAFSMPELSRILGILLDNAIEATKITNSKYIRLEMKYDAKKNADIIRVINTFDVSKQINTTNIFDKGVSSKEKKSGLGLWEVRRLIDKSLNAQIFAAVENGKFVQTIVIEKITN